MKTIQVIKKSLKEQLRSYWVLLLTLSMGPFFIFVYFLIIETSKPQYKILIVNNDQGVISEGKRINNGNLLIDFYESAKADTAAMPFKIGISADQAEGVERIKNKKADALIIINNSFSEAIESQTRNDSTTIPGVEFMGDLTSTNYLISAVWANEVLNRYILKATNGKRIVEVKETALGVSGRINDFDIIVPRNPYRITYHANVYSKHCICS